MTSVLASFATHWFHSAPAPAVQRPAATPRTRAATPGTTIAVALKRAYRAAQRAKMRRIRMELSLYGLAMRRGRA